MAANQPSGKPSSGGSSSSSGTSPRTSTPPGARPRTAPSPAAPSPAAPSPAAASPAAAGGQKRGRNRGSADRTVQTFRSPTALVVWVVWLLFAAANWVDLAVQGRDHTSAIAAALLLLATGFAYVVAQRPRIIADDAGITVRNPLRDHRIGWAGVTKVDLVDLLRVHCDWAPGGPGKHTKVISSWAVHYSRRRQLTAEAKARRGSRPRRSSFGAPSGGRGLLYGGGLLDRGPTSPPASAAEAEAEKIARLLNERATAAQAETGMPGPTAGLEPLKNTWSPRALAAILIPALILQIVCLV